MTITKYDAGPRTAPKKPERGSGRRSPPVGSGFGIPPATRVRVRPHYPELPVPGPRRDMGWVWDLKNKTLKKCSGHLPEHFFDIVDTVQIHDIVFMQTMIKAGK